MASGADQRTDHLKLNTTTTKTNAPQGSAQLLQQKTVQSYAITHLEETKKQYGGIGLSSDYGAGAQDAPTSGDTLHCDDTITSSGGSSDTMVDEETRRSEERVVAVAAQEATTQPEQEGAEQVATADSGDITGEEPLAGEEKEQLDGDGNGFQAAIDPGEEHGKSEEAQTIATTQDAQIDISNLTTGHDTTIMPEPAPALTPAPTTALLPEPMVTDTVHIVDSDTNPTVPEDLQVEALQQQAGELNIKAELPPPELPVPSLAPPFEMEAALPPLDPLPYTSDGLLEQYNEEPAAAPVQPATGFAKLEFQDGHFYMTTYAVELGRDMRAYRVAQQYQARIQHKAERHTGGAKHRHQRSASVPGTPVRPIKNDTAGMSARSFLSESGGIVGEDDGHIKLKRRKKKKSSKSKSTDTSSSHSHSMSRKNSIVSQPLQSSSKFDYNLAAAMQTVDPNATAPLDPMVHMPDPHFTPLIPVHPPMNTDEEFQTGKGISRKHIRISYNFDRCHFEMAVYGRNGAFHDEQHHPAGATVPLHDGSVIQIGGVSLRFVLPTVALEATEQGETDFDSVSGRMSFNFENAEGESVILDEDELEEFSSPSARARAHAQDYDDYGYDDEALLDEEDEEGDVDEDDEDEDEEDEDSSEEEPIKKRGPGRPRIHERKTLPKSKGKATVASSKKTPTKITIKISAREKARERERARLRAEAEERERKRTEAKAKAAKLKAKEAAKAKAKAKAEAEAAEAARERAAKKAKEADEARARKEAEKQPQVKEESKEASKTPAASAEPSASASKELSASAPRIARDAPMQNGEDINVPGLPAGIIIPARKKGPGRPPKDGVMSKRERAQLIKQAKEREKAIKLGLDPALIPALPTSPPRPSKPKPVRRNSAGEIISAGEDDAPKVARPPRSPSPEMRIEDYTEEQLQRPSANYVYLIYEAIKNSKAGVMNLQQIYAAIERRYPWYRFRAGSHGWQSSVRHNLGQHEAFKKVEKEGKGWLWGIKEGVPIERERKKKSPPPQPHPPYGQGYPPYPQPYNGGQYPPYPPGQAGHYQQRPPGAPPTNGQQNQNRPPGQGAPQQPNTYGPPYANGQAPPNNGNRPPYRPPYPPPNQQPKRYKPPSAEVVDTFKKVFISTYASRNDNNTAKAEQIVTNAIKRVLEPDTMVGVPRDTQEENVMRAFEGILVQSLGPPRSLGQQRGSQGRPPPPAQQGHPPSGQQGHGSPPTQQHGGQPPLPGQAPPHGQPMSASGTPQPPPASSGHPPSASPSLPASHHATPNTASRPPGQSAPLHPHASHSHPHTQQRESHGPSASRPQGPAEQSLFGMLIGGPSPNLGAGSRSASGTPVHNVPGAPHQSSGQTPAASSQTPSGTMNGNADASNSAHGSTPAIAASTTNPTPPSAVPNTAPQAQMQATSSQPAGLGLNVNTTLPKDTVVLDRPYPSALPPNGIPRTMTPTRPAIEPLTPPAIASPKVGTPTVASAAGIKRARSPEVPVAGNQAEGSEAKKVKVDEA